MKFNENQSKAIEAIEGNIVVTASAGSGKTTVLVERIANMVNNHNISPPSILAITFSKKAKENMIDKLSGRLNSFLGDVSVETFHSLALKIIQSAYGFKHKVWTISYEKENCLKDIVSKNMKLCNQDELPFDDIMSYFSTQKLHMLKPTDVLIYSGLEPYCKEDMQQIYMKYENYKESNNLIEFDDFLNMVDDIFNENEEILTLYQNKFKYILSDEYQDINLSQVKMIERIANGENFFVVGDAIQLIFSFRGADSKYMLDFDIKHNDTNVLSLNMNYRSSADIIATANELAKSIPESKHRNYVESVPFKATYKKPIFTEYTDAYDEGRGIADKILELCKSGEYEHEDFAVLARTNAQLQKLEMVMYEKKVPFTIVDGSLFTEITEIKILLSYLRLAFDTEDNESFKFMYNKPNRWLSKKFLGEVEANCTFSDNSLYSNMNIIARRNWRFKKGIDEIYDVIGSLKNDNFTNVGKMVEFLRNRLPIDMFVTKGKPSENGDIHEQSENMDSFQDMCSQFETIEELLVHISELNKHVTSNNDKSKVKLITIHKSKGLEYPVVFLTGCSDGILPHYKSEDDNDERRLCYVGVTRAEKELYLSSIQFHNNKLLEISPFIAEMGDTIDYHIAN